MKKNEKVTIKAFYNIKMTLYNISAKNKKKK